MITQRIVARFFGHFDVSGPLGPHLYIYVEGVDDAIYHCRFERRNPVRVVEDAVEKFILETSVFRTVPVSALRRHFEKAHEERARPVSRAERKFQFIFRGDRDSTLQWKYSEDVPFVLVLNE